MLKCVVTGCQYNPDNCISFWLVTTQDLSKTSKNLSNTSNNLHKTTQTWWSLAVVGGLYYV